MTTQELTINGRSPYSPDEVSLIKTQIAPGASDAELKLFLAVSGHLGLSPLKRQIYAIQRSVNVAKKGEREQWESRMTIQVSVDGLLAIAERSREFAGVTDPEWADDDGNWHDVWVSASLPIAAKVGVYRRGWRAPVYGIAMMKEYAQGNSMWRDKPTHMLEKCALAKALRRAFPNEFSDVSEATDVSTPTDYVDTETGEIHEEEFDAGEMAQSLLAAGLIEPAPAPTPPPAEPAKAQAKPHRGPEGSSKVDGTVYLVGDGKIGVEKQGKRIEFAVSAGVSPDLMPTADHLGCAILCYAVAIADAAKGQPAYQIVEIARLEDPAAVAGPLAPPEPTPAEQPEQAAFA